MGCNCKQGYVMPGVNRTPCGCQLGLTGGYHYGLGRPVNEPFALGGPWRPNPGGMGRLMSGTVVAAGTHVQYGFEFQWNATSAQSAQGEQTGPYVSDAVSGQLYSEGIFSSVNVIVKEPAYLGIQNGYITVDGFTALDYPDVISLQSDIKQAIAYSGAPVTVTRADSPNIQETPINRSDAVQPPQTPIPTGKCPAGYQDVSHWWQFLSGPNCQPIPAGGTPPPPPGTCDLSTMSFSNYLSCQFGTLGIGAAGGMIILLAGVFLILKR